MRLGADVLAWFRAKKQYQTTINKALREYMETPRRAGQEETGLTTRLGQVAIVSRPRATFSLLRRMTERPVSR